MNGPFDSDNEPIVDVVLRPRDAATLILVRKDKDGPRVLMGKRHGAMVFMANKFVFPGGRLDPADARLAAGGDLRPEVLEKVAFGITPKKARGLALAAIRETFEEAGILIGERAAKIPRTRAQAWRKYFAHGIVPRLERIDFIARAITPPKRMRRFDARFFMADAEEIAYQLDAAANDELLTPCWVTPAEARALDLPAITRTVLDEVEARLESGPRRVPFFQFLRGKESVRYL